MYTRLLAFRAEAEDGESVKLSNTTSSRTSALTSALPARTPVSKGETKSEFLLATNEIRRTQPFAGFCAPISPSPITHYHSLTNGEL
jgi:hypothetical protein